MHFSPFFPQRLLHIPQRFDLPIIYVSATAHMCTPHSCAKWLLSEDVGAAELSVMALRPLLQDLVHQHRTVNTDAVRQAAKELRRVSTLNSPQNPFVPPNVAVSGCLLGLKVTYRGGCSSQRPLSNFNLLHFLSGHTGQDFPPLLRFVPYCPEVQLLGLSVPRPPIRIWSAERILLDASTGTPLSMGPVDGLRPDVCHGDATYAERAAVARSMFSGCKGFVLKSRSPSCGVGDARVYADAGGGPYESSDGFFVRDVARHVVGSPRGIVSEKTIRDEAVLIDFLEFVLEKSELTCDGR